MKYFLYARKSEEDKNRQVKSIGTQIEELRRRYPHVELVDSYEEAQTAKEPGRPLFNDMVERIRKGEAQGILVWHINRLLRNPVDQGTIQWMLQKRQLLSIQTMDKEHTPEDNVLILNVESGVANQFIIDLTKGTLRGLNSKVSMGWFPHRAPEGYLNDTQKGQGERDIVADPERFPTLRRAWEMMLSGSYSVPQILQELDRKGYRTKPHGKSANRRMSRSALYRVFNSQFYAGYFLHAGVLHKGKHRPMVTELEFNEVQRLLGKGLRISVQRQTMAYSGIIRCGRCGCQVVGEVRKRETQDGTHTHLYYHCSNGKRICNAKVVTEAMIDEEVAKKLSEISIQPRYRDFLLEVWRRYLKDSQSRGVEIAQTQQQTLAAKHKERDNLLSLRLREIIDDAMFRNKKELLDAEIHRLESGLDNSQNALEAKVEVAENVLLFATEPKDRYKELSPEDKRKVAMHLAARYFLTDRKLALEASELLLPLERHAREFEADCAAFERTNSGSESTKKEAFDRLCTTWGPIWDGIRLTAVENDLYFPLTRIG